MDNSTLSGDVEQFEAASYFPDNVEDVIWKLNMFCLVK